jgi:ribonuclease HII
MSAREVELLDAGVRVVPEAELNRSFARTCNKSVTVWQVTEPILRRVWERFGAQGVHMVADRQGGRFHYHPLLEAAFPEATVELVRERPSLSEYTLSGRGRDPRRMRLAFAERAERRSFAVALGSCIAKYARETCMAAFNAYFAGFDPDLKPTAGYRNDGWRWLEDASEIVARIDRKMLVRERCRAAAAMPASRSGTRKGQCARNESTSAWKRAGSSRFGW